MPNLMYPCVLTVGAILGAAASTAFGQCPDAWNTDIGTPGVWGTVYSFREWDPDGGGPLPPRLFAGGGFLRLGSSCGPIVNSIAQWDGSAWSGVAGGVDGPRPVETVRAMEVYGGALIVGGQFSWAGGVSGYKNLARWDGSAWSPFGLAVGGGDSVNAFAIFEGDLIAGGSFQQMDGVEALRVARWNGSQWSAFSTSENSVFNGVPSTFLVLNGQLYMGGTFHFINTLGEFVDYIAVWDGSVWRPLGPGLNNGIAALVEYNGELIAGGAFTQTPDAGAVLQHVARWDGSSWSPMGDGIMNGTVTALGVYHGTLYAGGQFSQAGGGPGNNIAMWDGTAWQPMGAGVDDPFAFVYTLLGRGSDLLVGGGFESVEGHAVGSMARWAEDCTCPADFNGDGFVTGDDFDQYVAAFELGNDSADFNHDGFVTGDDFDAFVVAFEAGC